MTNAIVKRDEARELSPAVLTAIERRNMIVEAMQSTVMEKDKDFGTIPGTDKPTLLKPGAEKLCTIFGLHVETPEITKETEDWTGKDHGEPFFYYRVCQRLTRNGETIAAQMGSCNSWEKKYRYRWVPRHEIPEGLDLARLKKQGGKISEFTFAVDKAETGGKYGKPQQYWQAFRDAIAAGTARKVKKTTKGDKTFDAWEIDSTLYRISNTDVADQVNTVLKMAQKRALVAATLVATNASEFFTQDVEDMEIIDAEFTETPRQPAPAKPAEPPNSNDKPAPSLLQRLTEKDAKLATEGWCNKGDLLKHLAIAGGKAGLGEGIGAWPDKEGFALAIAETKKFEEACRQRYLATDKQLKEIDLLFERTAMPPADRTLFLQERGVPPGVKLTERQAQSVILELQQVVRDLADQAASGSGRDPGEDEENDDIAF